MKKIIYLLVIGIAMLKTLQAQTFNSNLSIVLQAKLDSLVTAFAGNTKGVSIGIYCPGQGYWNGVSGISHPGVNITQDMKYGIASNSKLFTAVTMLKLQEDQILRLDDQLSLWLPPIPNVDPTITIRQLLNHTSGVSDPFFSTALLDSIEAHPTHLYTTAEVFTWVGAPLFPVGTSYSYSNTNYILAGMVAENATGQSMAHLLRNYVLTPLSLNNTFYDFSEVEILPLAHRWHNALDYNDTSRISVNSAGGPAGSVFSNGEDMVKWYHKLMDGQVLTPNSFNELTNFISFGALGNYGLGIQRTTFFNRETWGHGGSTLGYKSRSLYDPCNKIVVCGLSNDDWSAIDGITLLMYKTILNYIPDCSTEIIGQATVCEDQSITYTVSPIINATSYSWVLPNGATGISATNTIVVNFPQGAISGNISVKGINMYGEGTPSFFSITINPLPSTPVISQIGNTLHSDALVGNQWFDQNGILVGETNQDFNFLHAGSYYSIVSLLACTSAPSNTINTFDAGLDEDLKKDKLEVFPNPTNNELNLVFKGTEKNITYKVTNMINQEIMKGEFHENVNLNFSEFEKGVYLVRVEHGAQSFVQKIIKN